MVHPYHEGLHPTPTIRPLPTGLVEPTDAHACRGDSVTGTIALWFMKPVLSNMAACSVMHRENVENTGKNPFIPTLIHTPTRPCG